MCRRPLNSPLSPPPPLSDWGGPGAAPTKKQLEGPRPRAAPRGGARPPNPPPVPPRRNLLDESLGAAAHHDQTLLHVDHDATSCFCVKDVNVTGLNSTGPAGLAAGP